MRERFREGFSHLTSMASSARKKSVFMKLETWNLCDLQGRLTGRFLSRMHEGSQEDGALPATSFLDKNY